MCLSKPCWENSFVEHLSFHRHMECPLTEEFKVQCVREIFSASKFS